MTPVLISRGGFAILCGMLVFRPEISTGQVASGDGPLIAASMRANRGATDTLVLDSVTAPAQMLRDNSVFQAAIEISGDHSAAPEARVFAFRVLIQQLRPGYAFSFGQLAHHPIPGSSCLGGGYSLHGPATVNGSPLPSDALAQVATRVALTIGDGSETTIVRNAAVCARAYGSMTDPLPERDYHPIVTATDSITISYICGNKFTVRNPEGISVDVVYLVGGSSETGRLTLPEGAPASEITLVTTQSGLVTILEDLPDGEEIAHAANGGIPCP